MSIEPEEEHSQDDDARNSHAGQEVGGSTASISAGFLPEPLRFLFYQPAMRILVSFSIFLILVMGCLIGGGYAVSGPGLWPGLPAAVLYALTLLLTPILLVTLLFLSMGYGPGSRHHRDGLLVPGVVVSSKPLALVVLAPLGNGTGPRCNGLERIEPGLLPYHSHEPGTRVPLASLFYHGKDIDRWVSYVPEPISWGTGRWDLIDQCFDLIGDEDFKRLEACIAKGMVPLTDDELILLDEHDRTLEKISIKEEKKKFKAGEHGAK